MNKLSKETSPYLLQHADNPVDWYPWGEDALALAKSQNKPILLSIGYSACHWCHVMAHESFEDENTAMLMNQHFINIKVDREERPDIDKLYQSAHQLLTQRSGGWPLTMFLMPDDQMPFFGGTYFPDKPRYQMPSFKQLLFQVSSLFKERKDDIQAQSDSLADALNNIYRSGKTTMSLNSAPLDQARMDLQQQFDKEQGGFGVAPKFPHTPFIERLLRHSYSQNNHNKISDKKAFSIATFTLEKMARGGVNDQLGGGFCRYSTDNDWMIPHFEKMLYDNGALLAEYVHANAIQPNPLFERTCHETAQWVMREMQSDASNNQGGYYSSYDADSKDEKGHPHEGLFYVWSCEEVSNILSKQEYAVFSRRFGLDKKANFEGHWHLHIYVTMQELAKEFNQPQDTLTALIDSAKLKLQAVRNQRTWPDRDEKILTSWNGLMIRSMALTARYLNTPEYAESATQAVDFIRNVLWSKKEGQNGKLFATYKADGNNTGKAHLNAYLDDYVFLFDALLELLQVRWRTEDLDFAIQIADTLLEQFEDKQNGGFWFVSHDHERLIQRPKTYADDAIPNGNGVAVFSLARLGYLVGETRYLDASERALQNASTALNQAPSAHCTLLKGLEEYLNPPETVIIRGDVNDLNKFKNKANQVYAPRRQCYFIPESEQGLPAGLNDKKPADDRKPVAYICQGMTCLPPVKGDLIVTTLNES